MLFRSGIFGDFYDSLYGSDVDEEVSVVEVSESVSSSVVPSVEVSESVEESVLLVSVSSPSSSSEATGLISLLGKYSKALTKGIFGDFYDALYGSEVEEGDGSNSHC